MSMFRKAFKPSAEEKQKMIDSVNACVKDTVEFWKSHGLTDEQIEKLDALEAAEFREANAMWIRPSYFNRRSLLESGIITLDQVKEDIENADK